jgi:hypothetical protein
VLVKTASRPPSAQKSVRLSLFLVPWLTSISPPARDSLTALCAPPDEPDEFPAWLLAVVGIAAFAAGFAIVILPVALYICVRRPKNTQTSPKKQHSRLHSRNHADEEKRVAKHAEAVGHTETAP